jgi:nucleoside-diphosphate-sugar epimerase
MNLEKIFITGGAGFIGSAITESFVQRGHEVTVYDDFSRGSKRRLRHLDNVHLVNGDIRDFDSLKKALTKNEFKTVVHLAYINGTQNFYSRPKEVLDVALIGMQNIIKVVSSVGIKRFFLASSSEVYQNPGIFPTPEEISLVVPNPNNPRYSYGLGKIVQEFMALHYLSNMEQVIIFRPHNIYGQDMGFGHVIPELFAKISKSSQEGITLKGDGKQTRSFCHIDDFIRAFQTLYSINVGSGIYNIGSKDEVNILNLATLISNLYGGNKKFILTPEPLGETTRRLPDLSKIEKLGYSPKVSLTEGLDKYFTWYSSISNELDI